MTAPACPVDELVEFLFHVGKRRRIAILNTITEFNRDHCGSSSSRCGDGCLRR
jgi:hypothetical protein